MASDEAQFANKPATWYPGGLTIGDRTYRVAPGGSWCIPGDVEHNVVAHEESVAI